MEDLYFWFLSWEGLGMGLLILDTTPSPPQSGAGSSGTPPALLRRNGYAKAREGEKYSTNKWNFTKYLSYLLILMFGYFQVME